MSQIFRTLHHLCIVHDVEMTAAYSASVGIGPWQDYPPRSAVQLQLCQPGEEDGPQRRFLDTHGGGVFHLGFDVPDWDAAGKVGFASSPAPSAKA